MEHTKLTELLNKVAQGEVSVEKAALELKTEPFEDLGFAKLDHHRKIRQGAAEVIYGAGKTPEQILKITEAFRKKGDNAVLITRMSQEAADLVCASLPLRYDALSRTGIVGELPEKDGNGKVVIATGGTSDLPVAEEAALTAEVLGNEVVRIYDVGVAGKDLCGVCHALALGGGGGVGRGEAQHAAAQLQHGGLKAQSGTGGGLIEKGCQLFVFAAVPVFFRVGRNVLGGGDELVQLLYGKVQDAVQTSHALPPLTAR